MKQQYKGIIYIVISAFCFAVMNMMVRMSGDLPTIQKSFFRNIVAAIFACVILVKNRGPFCWQKGNLKLLLLRATFGTLGVLCNFYAVDHLVLSDASMLNKMSPFFAVFCSVLILREKVSFPQVVIVLTAFAGSLFVIKPTFANMDILPSIIGLMGGLGAGIAYTFVRKLGLSGEKGPFIVSFSLCFPAL